MNKKPPARTRKPEEALYHLVEVLDVLRLGIDTFRDGRKSTWMIVSAYLHQLLIDKTNGNKPLAARVIPSLKLHPILFNASSKESLRHAPVSITNSNLEIFDWSKPRIPLDDWLSQVAYIQLKNQQGISITIGELIKMPRHQAGGVHFDEEVADTMHLIEGVLTFAHIGEYQLTYRDYLVAIGDYVLTELNSDLMGCLGNGYLGLGQEAKAKEFLQTAIRLSRVVENRDLLLEQLTNLGKFHYKILELSKSELCYTEALSISQSLNDKVMEYECQRSLAIVYLNLGNKDSENANNEGAIRFYKKALAFSRTIGDRAHEIILLSNLGIVYKKLGALRNATTIWLAVVLLDVDIDDVESTHAGPIKPIIGEVINNLSIIKQDNPKFDTNIREIALNWKQAITEATSQDYMELEPLNINNISKKLANLLENIQD